jgi:hypothetical protein
VHPASRHKKKFEAGGQFGPSWTIEHCLNGVKLEETFIMQAESAIAAVAVICSVALADFLPAAQGVAPASTRTAIGGLFLWRERSEVQPP